MQDLRYKKLRQNLDRMMFLEHLNPDSVELVQKILNQNTRLLQTFNKLKKKSSVQPKADTANLEHQIDLLNQKYGQAMQQNQRLKKKLDDNGIQQKIITLQSALNSCRVKYQKKLDQLNEKVTNYQFQIQQLTIQKSSISDENQRIKVMLDKSKNDNQNNFAQLSKILQKKKKQIQRLQQENSKYRLQIDSLQRIYNQEKQSKSNSDGQAQKKSVIAMQVLKQQLAQTQHKLKENKKSLDQQRQINQQLKQNIKNLTQKINQLKNQQEYAKNSYHIESNAKSKFQIMYADTQNKVDELKSRITDLEQQKSEQKKQISRLEQKISDISNKNKKIMGEYNRLQEQLTVLNGNFTNKSKQLRQAQNQKIVYEHKIKQLQIQLRQYQQHNSQTNSQLSKDTNSARLAQQYEKKMIILQKQIQITQSQLKMMQENQNAILSQKAKLETEIKKLQLIISQGNKQIELAQMHKQNLMKENKQLKSHLSSTQSQGYNNKSETLRLKQKIDEYEIMIQDLRIALRNQQNTSKLFAQKALQYQKAVQQQISNNKQIFEDNKQLKLMVSSLQKTKADLFEKYRSTNEQKAVKEDHRLEYLKQYNKLMQQYKQNQQRLRKKQCALSELSNQYDNLQNILDDKTVQNTNLLEKIRKLEKELTSYDRSIGQRQINLQGQQNQIKNLQRQYQKLQKMYNMKCEELNDCQVALNRRNLDAQQLNNQVSLLVMNNKQYEKSTERDRLKMQQLQRKLKDKLKQVDQYRQISSCTKIQNQALVQQVRRQKQQFRNLENYSNQVVEEYNKIYNIVMQKDITLRELEQALNQLQFKQNQHVNQIGHYQRQLRSLSQQMIKKDQQLRRLAEDRDVYRAEVNTSRRNYSSSTDWKVLYQQKIQALQNELSIKKRQCQTIKSQLRRYQKLIESERQKNFYLEQEVKKSKVNDSSQTPIKLFYKSRVQSQNWNGYNRDLTDLQRNSHSNLQYELQKQRQRQKSIKMSRNSNSNINTSSRISQSFQSQKVSLSSKQCYQNLDQITRQYNATINVKKINR